MHARLDPLASYVYAEAVVDAWTTGRDQWKDGDIEGGEGGVSAGFGENGELGISGFAFGIPALQMKKEKMSF